jgi:di/tripeptidase
VLKELIGDDIITADGTTLLGSDDKSGCAEIMTMIDILRQNPQIKHGTLAIAFTPDEEVGTASRSLTSKVSAQRSLTPLTVKSSARSATKRGAHAPRQSRSRQEHASRHSQGNHDQCDVRDR